ncbi:TolC family protein [Thermodesulfobacteriota bacterium]
MARTIPQKAPPSLPFFGFSGPSGPMIFLMLGLALAALLSFPTGAPAVSGAGDDAAGRVHNLTLADVIRMGRESSPQLWVQKHVIEQAEAQLGQARAGRLPRLEYLQITGLVPEARGDATFSPDDRSCLLDGLGPFTRIEITLSQPLYTFGRLKAHIEAAQLGLEAEEASHDRFERELVSSLKELYYTIQLNEEIHRIVSKTKEGLVEAVEKAEALLEEDELTQQDLQKLRYGLARAGGQLLEIEKGRRLVHAALLRMLYLPEGEDFRLAEKRLRPIAFELEDLDTYRKIARRERPDWEQLDVGISAKEAELRAERKEYYPDLFLAGLFRYATAPNRDEQDNPFVSEEFNFLEGGVYLGCRLALDFGLPQRIAEKRAELDALLQKRKDANSGMLLEVEKAYREVEEKQERLVFTRESRKNGRALVALSTANFHLGLGEAEDVFESFRIYTEAAAEYYMTVKDYNMAVAELARAAGVVSLEQ